MRQKDLAVEPFVYVLAVILPGLLAVPVKELKEKEDNKKEKEDNGKND